MTVDCQVVYLLRLKSPIRFYALLEVFVKITDVFFCVFWVILVTFYEEKRTTTAAYNNIAMKVRNHIPQSFEIDIEGWKQQIANGSEQDALCQEAEKEFTKRRDIELASVVQSKWDMIIPIVLAIAMIPGFISGPTWGFICLIAAAGFGFRWYLNKKNCEKMRQNIFDKYVDIIKSVKDTIAALCAERVDFIAEINERDSVSQQTAEYLEAIEVGQYVANGGHRNVVA